jgi:hypothetical protein
LGFILCLPNKKNLFFGFAFFCFNFSGFFRIDGFFSFNFGFALGLPNRKNLFLGCAFFFFASPGFLIVASRSFFCFFISDFFDFNNFLSFFSSFNTLVKEGKGGGGKFAKAAILLEDRLVGLCLELSFFLVIFHSPLFN